MRQFREIFTEEGRRQVKITHQVPGRAPVVTYTQVCNVAAMPTTKHSASSSAALPTTSTAQVDVCPILRYYHYFCHYLCICFCICICICVTNLALWLRENSNIYLFIYF